MNNSGIFFKKYLIEIVHFNLKYILMVGILLMSCEDPITKSSDILDCDNKPNGSAIMDDCGLCTGGTTVFEFNYLMDCDGVCGGSALEDCAGICMGSAVLDECDVCGGDGIDYSACDCDGNVADCTGECGGSAELDECGICNGPGAIEECSCEDIPEGACDCAGNVADCAGECGGSTVEDECGECGGDGIAEGTCDCDGNVKDCAGECDGSAVEDCASICNGTSEEDCAGACNGSAVLNDCGVCGSDNSTCIVINEINYNSSDDYDPEDWVELYNSSESQINIGNWKVRDEENDHVFPIPENTILSAGDFLVLCRDTIAFTSRFPEVTNYIGDLGFGLEGGRDMVRLFDTNEILIDEVEYDDEYPWPEEADGEGYTLELIHPSLDNSLAENWLASLRDYGTPGGENSVYNGQ